MDESGSHLGHIFLRATAITVAEALVWNQVTFLPHWLSTATEILAVLSLFVSSFKSQLEQYSIKLARLTPGIYVAFAASVGYAFLGNLQPAPFSGRIAATTDYVGTNPISLFMVLYDSKHGATASPVNYLMYIELVNQANYPIRIDMYSVSISRSYYIPWWHKLPPIPLTERPVYALGVPEGGKPNPNPIWFPKGTYLMGEYPEGTRQLHYARMITFSPQFDAEIRKPIDAHQTIEGWAAFDRADDIVQLKDKYLNITIRDSTGAISQSIVGTPLPIDSEVDTSTAIMQPTTTETDLSGCYIKFYSEP